MAINSRNGGDLRQFSQNQIANQSFDQELQTSVFQPLGYDGQSLQRLTADNLAIKVTTSGTATYVAIAAPGSSTSDAVWQVKKIDESTDTIVNWADGNSNFDNIATDLTALSYS